MKDIIKENYRILDIQECYFNRRPVVAGNYYVRDGDSFVFRARLMTKRSDTNFLDAINELDMTEEF